MSAKHLWRLAGWPHTPRGPCASARCTPQRRRSGEPPHAGGPAVQAGLRGHLRTALGPRWSRRRAVLSVPSVPAGRAGHSGTALRGRRAAKGRPIWRGRTLELVAPQREDLERLQRPPLRRRLPREFVAVQPQLLEVGEGRPLRRQWAAQRVAADAAERVPGGRVGSWSAAKVWVVGPKPKQLTG
jgi:hypothetical protein